MSARVPELTRWNRAAAEFVMVYWHIPEDQRAEPIDGGWSAHQILQHVLEYGILFSARMRTAIDDPSSTILPFDPVGYRTDLSYALVPDDMLLDAPLALRVVNIGWLRALPEDARQQKVAHPGAGDQSVEQIATTFGDHIADHRNDIQNAGLSRKRL